MPVAEGTRIGILIPNKVASIITIILQPARDKLYNKNRLIYKLIKRVVPCPIVHCFPVVL